MTERLTKSTRKAATIRTARRLIKVSGKRSLLGISRIRRAVRLVLRKRTVSSKR